MIGSTDRICWIKFSPIFTLSIYIDFICSSVDLSFICIIIWFTSTKVEIMCFLGLLWYHWFLSCVLYIDWKSSLKVSVSSSLMSCTIFEYCLVKKLVWIVTCPIVLGQYTIKEIGLSSAATSLIAFANASDIY